MDTGSAAFVSRFKPLRAQAAEVTVATSPIGQTCLGAIHTIIDPALGADGTVTPGGATVRAGVAQAPVGGSEGEV